MLVISERIGDEAVSHLCMFHATEKNKQLKLFSWEKGKKSKKKHWTRFVATYSEFG
jgi:hypothetical protein